MVSQIGDLGDLGGADVPDIPISGPSPSEFEVVVANRVKAVREYVRLTVEDPYFLFHVANAGYHSPHEVGVHDDRVGNSMRRLQMLISATDAVNQDTGMPHGNVRDGELWGLIAQEIEWGWRTWYAHHEVDQFLSLAGKITDVNDPKWFSSVHDPEYPQLLVPKPKGKMVMEPVDNWPKLFPERVMQFLFGQVRLV